MGQNLSVALLYAAAAGDVPEICRLHERGADINAQDQDSRWAPIHYAAWGGHAAAVRELLVRGAEVNARDLDRKTPLHYAVLGGHGETVEALCNHAALVNAADVDGQTPLHKAAVQGQLALVQELLARGANPDARLKDGSTPAHLAAWRGHHAALGCLLQNGADAGAATADGDTPLHEAAKAGHEACCRLLLTHGASRAALNAAGNTPSDAALLSDLIRVAELVRPAPGEVEAAQRLRQPAPGASSSEARALPSAPAWADGPVSYPVIDVVQRQPAAQPSVLRPSQQQQQQAAKGQQAAAEASDWEPQPEQDWEAVSPQGPVPGRGAQLMAAYSDQEGPAAAEQSDPLWMVPGPVKWAAASVGGRLAGLLPWRRAADAEQPQQAQAETADAADEAREESEPAAAAADLQAARLSAQEAEIAELRRRLADTGRVPEGEAGAGEQRQAAGGAYPAISSIAGGKEASVGQEERRSRPAAQPAPSCREFAPEELHAATDGFSAANRLSSDAAGSSFAGTLRGEAVTVWVPAQQGALPWHALQPGADRLAALRPSRRLVRVQAACRDGSLVLDHLPNGSLEDALRSHAPRRGRAPVRLAWPARVAAAAQAAEGLAALHAARPPLPHGALRPAAVLLSEAREAALRPPSLPALALGPQAEGLSAATAPEVRRGGPPSPQADVWSLGLLLLQLLTGAEPSGLLEYVRSASGQGRLADVLDPCAEGISAAGALPLAKLALRCAEERPEDRPDLRSEVLPQLQRLSQAAADAAAAAAAGEQPGDEAEAEPPAHLVCPITQEVLVKPVIAADGYTYEEAAIQQWLQNGRQVSPMTNAPLPHTDLTPNFVIQSAASTWREQHAAPQPAPQPLQARVAELNRRLATAAGPPAAPVGNAASPEEAAGEAAGAQGERDVLAELPDVPRTRVPATARHEAAESRRQALAE